MIIGLSSLIKQHKIISHAKPVEATVVAKEMRKSECELCPDYMVFEYQYTANQRVYKSKNTDPTDNYDYREDYLLREKGDKITAYYDPLNPEFSFLVRQYSYVPYAFVFISSFFVFAALYQMIRLKPQIPAQSSDNKQFILCPVSIKKNIFVYLTTFFIFSIVNFFSLTNYFLNEWNPLFVAYVLIVAAVGTGIFFFYKAVVNLLFYLYLKETVILLDSSEIRLGEIINIEVQQTIKRNVKIKKALVGIIARSTNMDPSPKVYEDWKSGMDNYSVPGGESISMSSQFQIPSVFKRKSALKFFSVRIDTSELIWHIEYKLILKFLPVFKATVFPEIEYYNPHEIIPRRVNNV